MQVDPSVRRAHISESMFSQAVAQILILFYYPVLYFLYFPLQLLSLRRFTKIINSKSFLEYVQFRLFCLFYFTFLLLVVVVELMICSYISYAYCYISAVKLWNSVR